MQRVARGAILSHVTTKRGVWEAGGLRGVEAYLGASPRIRQRRAISKTRLAVHNDDAAAVDELVEAGVDLEFRRHRCLPAVHQASLDGRTAVIEALLDCGASVSQLADGYLPLGLAATYRHLDAMKLILRYHPTAVDGVDGFGMTPLLASVLVGELQSCALLVVSGANLDATVNDRDAKYLAQRRGRHAILELLKTSQNNTTAVLPPT